jgi:hypothetical protein
MQCLRCNYCCRHLAVTVVKDPTKVNPKEDFSGNFPEENTITLMGDGTPCPHLKGNHVGGYSCAIHHYPWYRYTPCFAHTQVETKNSPCRTGEHFLKQSLKRIKR